MSHNTYMEPVTAYDGQKQEYAKVTAVRIRFHVESADWLPQPIREKFLKKVNFHLVKINIGRALALKWVELHFALIYCSTRT